MRKYFIIPCVILLALSCTVQESQIESVNSRRGKVTFTGETFTSTKTTIGDLSGTTYPVYWSEGDQIGIYTTDNMDNLDTLQTPFVNASATLNSKFAGKNSGVFILDDDIDVVASMNLVVYYPFDEFTTFSDNSLHSSVKMEQFQAAPNETSHLGKYTLAYDSTSIEPNEDGASCTFSLTHPLAYVKFVISSSEFSSYYLNGVSIWADGGGFSGLIDVNTTTNKTTTSALRDYVVLTVEEPQLLSSTQELWLVTLPTDLSDKDVYVSVSMSDGEKNVTIPKKVSAKELKAGAVNTIEVSNVSSSDNTFAWYETEETRYLAEGYAYSSANTYIIEKTGSEATINIDAKARGYFIGCEKPVYAKIIFSCNMDSGNKWLSLGSSTDWDEYYEINENYTFPVYFTQTSTNYPGYIGKVGICNENKEFIWAVNVWLLPTHEEHQYKNGVVMDRYIGDGCDPSNDNWYGYGGYFQWGRPFVFGWPASLCPGTQTYVTDLTVSAKHPDTMFYYGTATNNKLDWWLGMQTGARSDRKDDFWGNPNHTSEEGGSTENGTKSIFDPCPKGWMVVSPAILKEVMESGTPETRGSTIRSIIYKYDGVNEAYWHYSGLKWAETGGNPTNQTNTMVLAWSNSPWTGYASDNHNVYYMYKNTSSEESWTDHGARAYNASVRCMKDEDNR